MLCRSSRRLDITRRRGNGQGMETGGGCDRRPGRESAVEAFSHRPCARVPSAAACLCPPIVARHPPPHLPRPRAVQRCANTPRQEGNRDNHRHREPAMRGPRRTQPAPAAGGGRGGGMAAPPRDTFRSGTREGGGRRGRHTGGGAVARPQPPSTRPPASQTVHHGKAVGHLFPRLAPARAAPRHDPMSGLHTATIGAATAWIRWV